MIRRILLATNGSNTSLAAEDYALHLASSLGADLTVVHIRDDRLAHYGEVDHLMNTTTKKQFVSYIHEGNDTATRRIIDNFSQKAAKRNVKHTVLLEAGSPERKIVALAEENAPDLLVIGSGTRSTRRFVPSAGIAAKLLKNSPCPVFTAV